MRVFMQWYGGSSYAAPSLEDTEEFASLAELRRSFDARRFDSYYPCVDDDTPEDGGPEGWIFFYDPREAAHNDGNPYPDRLIHYGPRGGLRIDYV